MAGTRIVAGRGVPAAGTYPVAMKLAGDLTIKDITLPVVAPYPWSGSRAMFTATIEIERQSWEMTWNVTLETGGWLVSENVVLDIEAQAILQGAESLRSQGPIRKIGVLAVTAFAICVR